VSSVARGFLRVHRNGGLDDFLQGMENEKQCKSQKGDTWPEVESVRFIEGSFWKKSAR
jgi:hypothetical protein